MKKIALLLLSVAALSTANAQITITGNGFNYTQDFNTLDTNAVNSTNLPNGWAIKELGAGTSANNKYRSGAGVTNAGDTYSFGASQNTDRALGSIASGSVLPSFGARFNNTSADTLKKVLVNYRVEQWRAGDTSSKPDTVYFMYSILADSVGDTTAANWIDIPGLMMNSIMPSATGSSGNALDGNLNTGMKSDSFNVIIPPGAHIIIKWIDKNILGADDALAVDDLNMIFKGGSTVNSIGSLNLEKIYFAVLGSVTANSIKVGYATDGGKFRLSIFDLNGRNVYAETIQTEAGAQEHVITNLNLTTGMYIIKFTDGKSVGIAKAIIK